MATDLIPKTFLRRFVLYHLPALLYALGIIALSSIPNLATPQIRIIAVDKVAHFLEYAIFAFLIFRSVSNLSRRPRLRWIVLLSALFLCIFALLDEIYQQYIPGRHMDVLDFVTDVGGALIVLTIMGRRYQQAQKRSE
ncbi:MAG: VanZ family protein [candidate division Zixibacteria bacterium]|nr:VanZ family protein [candidate division Zixibacteria bacterium]